MEVAGTVGRYRGRQAFMNTGFKFMTEICLEITFTIDFYFFLLSVTKATSGVGCRSCLKIENKSV